jgi:hypothetical protein
LETFGYIDVVVTSTDWDNFFHLRDHAAAMPEIQHLARAMRKAYNASTPRLLKWGEWHLPYIQPDELAEVPTYSHNAHLSNLRMYSVARCARVSYKPFDADEIDYAKDLALGERLMGADPLHASPAEHQATPDRIRAVSMGHTWDGGRHKWGNFFAWQQYRKFFPNENYQTQDRSIRGCLDRQETLNFPHVKAD